MTGFFYWNKMKDIRHHYFSSFGGNIKDSHTIDTYTLSEMLREIKMPDQSVIDLVEKIRSEQDADKKARLKWQLKSWTPAVLCSKRRRIDNIIGFSGLMPLDFDKLPSKEYAQDVREFLLKEYPWIYAVWLSSSGKGVRAIVRIPIVESTAEYKMIFDAVRHNHISAYEIIDYFDTAPKNAVLPLFQSYDPNLIFRYECEIFDERYTAPEPERKNYPPINETGDAERNRVARIAESGIGKIKDNGHPQLCRVCMALGGYVGGGYIDFNEAVDLMHTLIERNDYLSQKQSVYKVTAKQMIQYGSKNPLYL
jgi:hypothetical protein